MLFGKVIDLCVMVSVSLLGCRKNVLFFGNIILLFIIDFNVVCILVFGLFKLM